MRRKAALFSALIFAFVLAGQGADAPGKDGWSEEVEGLQARLVFGEDRVINSTHLPEVYLELHNASKVLNPREFDFGVCKSVRFDLRNSDGKPGPKHPTMSWDGPLLEPFHVTIPHGGTLKFPITASGWALPSNGGTMLAFQCQCWVIPATDKSKYFLSATFDIPQTPRESHHSQTWPWHGTIKIPSVELPAGK